MQTTNNAHAPIPIHAAVPVESVVNLTQSNVVRRSRWGPAPGFANVAAMPAIEDPMPNQVNIPAVTPSAAAPSFVPVVNHHQSGAAEGKAGVTSSHGLGPSSAEDEVMHFTVPAPKLNIAHDVKARESGQNTAERTRAFVRDAKQYLQLVRGGTTEPFRCLFLSNSLEGAAKQWYDSWTNARETYTSDELFAALLARFSPEVQPRDVEARQKLASGVHRMRLGESVPAYRTRFEALVTPIAEFTEGERMFWFQRGLSEELAGQCATDLSGRTFDSYSELVQFALGAELRSLARREAEKHVRSSLRAFSLSAQTRLPRVDNDADTDALEAPVSGPVAPRVATTQARRNDAAPHTGSGTGRPQSGRTSGHRSRGRKGQRQGVRTASNPPVLGKRSREPNAEEWLERWCCSAEEFKRRRTRQLCLQCASPLTKHATRDCPLLPPRPELETAQ